MTESSENQRVSSAFEGHQRSYKPDVCHAICSVCFLVIGAYLLLWDTGARSIGLARISTVVAAWEDPAAPTGWRQFQQLNASVVITQPSGGGSPSNDCQTLIQTVQLSPANCVPDHYFDKSAARRFGSVKQLSFCALAPDWSALQRCNMQFTFQVQQPGQGSPTTLTTIADAVGPAGRVSMYMDDIGIQYGCDDSIGRIKCMDRCEDFFSGSTDNGVCRSHRAYVSSLAIKVQYDPESLPPFSLDTKTPGMGPSSWGANVLPEGYYWANAKPAARTLKGPMWTYEGLSYGDPPGSLLLQIRSSSDPYLAYLAATKGNGAFGTGRKDVNIFCGWLLSATGALAIAGHVYGFCSARIKAPRSPHGSQRLEGKQAVGKV